MAERDINIRFTLDDKVTAGLFKLQGNIQKFATQVGSVGMEMRKLGREMSQIGMTMNMVGASIVTPLTLAYKEAGKYSASVSRQLNETKNVFQNLSITIGESLLPVMRQLTNTVAMAVDRWNSLDKTIRDKIIQSIFILGRNLIIVGTSLVVVGKAFQVLGNVALIAKFALMHPAIIAISVAFIGLGYAVWKCKYVADGLLNTLQMIARLSPILNIARIAQGKTPDEFFGKQGSMADSFQSWKAEMEETLAAYKEAFGGLTGGGGDSPSKKGGSFWEGFQTGITESIDALRQFRDIGIQVGQDVVGSMTTSFSSFFNDAFTGQLKRAKDYFNDFGKSLLKTFSDVIAKMLVQWLMFGEATGGGGGLSKTAGILGAISQLAGLFGGGGTSIGGTGAGAKMGYSAPGGEYYAPLTTGSNAVDLGTISVGGSYHKGGIVKAHNGMLASDEVPAILQTGERVLSRRQNKAYEQGGGLVLNYQPIVVIKAWDTADVMAQRKSIGAILTEDLMNNGTMRRMIRQYA